MSVSNVSNKKVQTQAPAQSQKSGDAGKSAEIEAAKEAGFKKGVAAALQAQKPEGVGLNANPAAQQNKTIGIA